MPLYHSKAIALFIIDLLLNLNLLFNLLEIAERTEGALCSIWADALVVSAAANEASIDRPFAFAFGIAFTLSLVG
jgi:hypothetical protein